MLTICDICRKTIPQGMDLVQIECRDGNLTIEARKETFADGSRLCRQCWQQMAKYAVEIYRVNQVEKV